MFLVAGAFGIVSCDKKAELDPLLNYIPNDAAGVLAVDVKSMAMKSVNFKDFFTLENMQKLFSGVGKNDSAANALTNSGIDLLSKMWFFGKGGDLAGYGGGICKLSDAAKFEAFLRETSPTLTYGTSGPFKLAVDEKKNLAIGWDNDKVIFTVSKSDVAEQFNHIANLSNTETLVANNKAFRDVMAQGGDVSVWLDMEKLQKFAPDNPSMPTPAINFKDCYISAVCHFEDGEIVINSAYAVNDEVARQVSFMNASIGDNVVGALPGGDGLIGLVGVGIDMKALYAYLEENQLTAGVGESVNQMTGLTMDELVGIFTGEFGATVNGVIMVDTEVYDWATGDVVTRKQPSIDYCAVVGIANNDNLKKILEKFTEQGMLMQGEGEGHYTVQDLSIVERDGLLLIAGKGASQAFITTGQGEGLNDELSGLLKKNASTMYVNFTHFPTELFEGNAMASKAFSNPEVEELIATSTPIEDNVSKGKIVLRFREKGVNSLVTLGRIAQEYRDELNGAVVAAAEAAQEQGVVN